MKIAAGDDDEILETAGDENLSLLPETEIARLEALQGAELNDAKKILATAATGLAHGQDAAEAAAETARKTFEEGAAADTLPKVAVDSATVAAGITVYELLVKAGMAASNGEARRLIKGNGVRLDDVAVTDEFAKVTTLGATGTVKLSAGKKRHALIVAG